MWLFTKYSSVWTAGCMWKRSLCPPHLYAYLYAYLNVRSYYYQLFPLFMGCRVSPSWLVMNSSVVLVYDDLFNPGTLLTKFTLHLHDYLRSTMSWDNFYCMVCSRVLGGRLDIFIHSVAWESAMPKCLGLSHTLPSLAISLICPGVYRSLAKLYILFTCCRTPFSTVSGEEDERRLRGCWAQAACIHFCYFVL